MAHDAESPRSLLRGLWMALWRGRSPGAKRPTLPRRRGFSRLTAGSCRLFALWGPVGGRCKPPIAPDALEIPILVFSASPATPRVMGILNVTPNSFPTAASRDAVRGQALDRAHQDDRRGRGHRGSGGEVHKPAPPRSTPAGEIARTLPVVTALPGDGTAGCSSTPPRPPSPPPRTHCRPRHHHRRERTARGSGDGRGYAGSGCGVVVMHMQGDPRTMRHRAGGGAGCGGRGAGALRRTSGGTGRCRHPS